MAMNVLVWLWASACASLYGYVWAGRPPTMRSWSASLRLTPAPAMQFRLCWAVLWARGIFYHCTGKTAYTFFDRATGEGFRVIAKRNQTPLSREERKQQIYTAPLEELFSVTVPKEPLPEKARIFTTLTCACCGEGVAEHMARLQDGKVVCLHCFHPYDR